MVKGIIFERPIVFLDVETTGTDAVLDKIVSIACIKISPDGTRVEKHLKIKPVKYNSDGSFQSVPIPKEASDIHGITHEDLKDSPTFKQISKSLHSFLEGADLGGYNSNSFDLVILVEEFAAVGIDFDLSNRALIDVLKLEMVLNPRTLSAVYNRYTGKELDGAHDAMIDTAATVEIFEAQVKEHNLVGAMEDIDNFSQGDRKRVDIAGKLCLRENQNGDEIICWSFGKWKHKPITTDKSYVNWFLGTSVPKQTREIILKNT